MIPYPILLLFIQIIVNAQTYNKQINIPVYRVLKHTTSVFIFLLILFDMLHEMIIKIDNVQFRCL